MQFLFPDASAPPAYREVLITPDQMRLFRQGWLPDEPPRATVALVHGYAEHSSRYAHVATHLADSGYATHTYDQRGYGRSQGRRAYIDAFRQYVDDLALFLEQVRERMTAEQPLFLFGHSMGGVVCAQCVLDRQPELAGLMLSSPALRPRQPNWLQQLSGIAGRLVPTLPTVPLNHEHLSRDPAVMAHTERDAFNYQGRLPARTGSELLRAARHVRQHLPRLTLPLLIMHGTGDKIIDPEGSRVLYQRAGASDKTLRLYDGFYHETLNDRGRERVLADLAAWLDDRAPSTG